MKELNKLKAQIRIMERSVAKVHDVPLLVAMNSHYRKLKAELDLLEPPKHKADERIHDRRRMVL